MPRYVILRHELPEGHGLPEHRATHWDLMLECDGTLRTWALAEAPSLEASGDAEPLADHRLAYLDYEGPVSGNRGSVTRHDSGQYELLNESAASLVLRIAGGNFPAYVTLREKGDGSHFWRVSFSALPTRG